MTTKKPMNASHTSKTAWINISDFEKERYEKNSKFYSIEFKKWSLRNDIQVKFAGRLNGFFGYSLGIWSGQSAS